MENARNELDKLLKNLGCNETDNENDYTTEEITPQGYFQSTLEVRFPDGRVVRGHGEGQGKANARIAAAQDVIDKLRCSYEYLEVNWDEINVEAQAGDALIKLGIYLSEDLTKSSDKSMRLQQLEPDDHLVEVFDHWKENADSDLAKWGDGLGQKKKSTVIESLLWQRYGKKIIDANAIKLLQSLLRDIDISSLPIE